MKNAWMVDWELLCGRGLGAQLRELLCGRGLGAQLRELCSRGLGAQLRELLCSRGLGAQLRELLCSRGLAAQLRELLCGRGLGAQLRELLCGRGLGAQLREVEKTEYIGVYIKNERRKINTKHRLRRRTAQSKQQADNVSKHREARGETDIATPDTLQTKLHSSTSAFFNSSRLLGVYDPRANLHTSLKPRSPWTRFQDFYKKKKKKKRFSPELVDYKLSAQENRAGRPLREFWERGEKIFPNTAQKSKMAAVHSNQLRQRRKTRPSSSSQSALSSNDRG
ncbi:hypothetical protein ANANG_G00258220, partial [Anguilla anguilla]